MPAGNVLRSVLFFLAIAFAIDIGPRILPQGLIATLPPEPDARRRVLMLDRMAPADFFVF
jgi:hypothetical protein